jgi:hypothetical protein
LRGCPETAVFLNRNPKMTPLALRENVEHNGALHRSVVIVSIETAPVPYVDADDRMALDDLHYRDDGTRLGDRTVTLGGTGRRKRLSQRGASSAHSSHRRGLAFGFRGAEANRRTVVSHPGHAEHGEPEPSGARSGSDRKRCFPRVRSTRISPKDASSGRSHERAVAGECRRLALPVVPDVAQPFASRVRERHARLQTAGQVPRRAASSVSRNQSSASRFGN